MKFAVFKEIKIIFKFGNKVNFSCYFLKNYKNKIATLFVVCVGIDIN